MQKVETFITKHMSSRNLRVDLLGDPQATIILMFDSALLEELWSMKKEVHESLENNFVLQGHFGK